MCGLSDDKQEQAWAQWDAAVTRCEALGWHYRTLLGELLEGHWDRHARTVADVDVRMYGPTKALRTASRCTRAAILAARWGSALDRSGFPAFLTELQHESRTNARLADVIAGWDYRISDTREALGAAVDALIATTLVEGRGLVGDQGRSAPADRLI